MNELLHALGIDWKLLLAQGANFLVVLIVLTFVLFKPLLRALAERRKKIEAGLLYTDEAEKKLASITEEKNNRLRQADETALGIIASAEEDAEKKAARILAEARKKGDSLLVEVNRTAERERLEALAHLRRDSRELLRGALLKAVAVKPEAVDEALVTEAVSQLKKQA